MIEKHGLFRILTGLHALSGHSSIITFKRRQNIMTAIFPFIAITIFIHMRGVSAFLILKCSNMQNSD
jgi:hypothetical protein